MRTLILTITLEDEDVSKVRKAMEDALMGDDVEFDALYQTQLRIADEAEIAAYRAEFGTPLN